MLCGQYESNAVALSLALGITDRAIEAYDVLLALLETELALNKSIPGEIHKSDNFTFANRYRLGSEENRTAAESVAKQLLSYLDSNQQNTQSLLSPWDNCVYQPNDSEEEWTSEHEVRLREHVSRLKAERSLVQGTFVKLESMQIESPLHRPSSTQEARKMDLELAVLMQVILIKNTNGITHFLLKGINEFEGREDGYTCKVIWT